MKITLAQLNYHIGNFEYNTEKIINSIKEAKNNKSDLVIFSELAVCGYFPFDLLKQKSFVKKCQDSIEKIIENTKDIAIIIGLPYIDKTNSNILYNSAAFINNGCIIKIFNKTILASNDVIDESRYFEPNNKFDIIDFKNKKIAVSICEDLIKEPEVSYMHNSNLYIKEIYNQNPDLIINIAALPYSHEHNKEIKLIKNVKKHFVPIIHVNQVGANSDLIFDGRSLVIDKNGNKILECKHFEEDIKTIDIDNTYSEYISSYSYDKISNIYNALVLGIKDYFKKSGFKKAVLGLSGGIDSAITLALAIDALGNENVDTILMPTKYSSDHSVKDSIDMADICKIKYHIINIENLRLQFEESLTNVFIGTKPNVTEENIQARIRGCILMAYSNKFGNIVLNTSNKSECAVGYSTLYGDMNGAMSVLGDVYKTDVYKLAEYINKNKGNIIPQNIIDKEPSAELRPDQKDNDSLPDYPILDTILYNYIENNLSADEIEQKGIDRKTIDFVIRLVNNSEYKRFQSAPILKVSSKSFGIGRKIPIVAKY